jgi:hypothetical protein
MPWLLSLDLHSTLPACLYLVWPGPPTNNTPASLPPLLQSVRNSFAHNTGNTQWLLPALLMIGTVLLILALWHKFKDSTPRPLPVAHDPDALFSQLLEHVDLNMNDKQLLKEMTAGARLAHPAACLFSPGLLDWARQIWIQEKGLSALSADRLARIDAIAVQLYDHFKASAPPAANGTNLRQPSPSLASS